MPQWKEFRQWLASDNTAKGILTKIVMNLANPAVNNEYIILVHELYTDDIIQLRIRAANIATILVGGDQEITQDDKDYIDNAAINTFNIGWIFTEPE